MAPSVNINRLAAIRQVLATGIATTPFPPPWPAVRPCRVHGGKSRPCGQLARRRNVGDVAAAIRQVLATGLRPCWSEPPSSLWDTVSHKLLRHPARHRL